MDALTLNLLDQILRTPEHILCSERVLPKVLATLTYLNKVYLGPSKKRQQNRVNRISKAIDKLKRESAAIESFLKNRFTLAELDKKPIEDPLLLIIRAGRVSDAERAAYGYATEILFEEIDEWLQKDSDHSVRQYAEQFDDSTQIRNDYSFGKKFAYLERQAEGLGQVACHAKWALDRLNYDDVPGFWQRFQKEQTLMELLTFADFRSARLELRAYVQQGRLRWKSLTQRGPASEPINSDVTANEVVAGTITRPQVVLVNGHWQYRTNTSTTRHLVCAFNLARQIQLTLITKVPDTARSIHFAVTGNIDGLKFLFNQGLARPQDLSESRVFSLLRWALYGGMWNYGTVQFLLGAGAPVDETSYNHVWDYALRQKCSADELIQLECILLNPPGTYTNKDWIEEQQFPKIHQIILRRLTQPLTTELAQNADAVYAKDAMGRTALDWATARAQLPDMRQLIDGGSPLNTMDISGRSLVLHAVDSHNESALRMVLEAGADPNPEVPEGLFRSSPLIAASIGGLVGMVELLLKFGAKPNTRSPEGHTAFMSAIMSNRYEVLKSLISWGNVGPWEELQPGRIIAEFADATTMSILASSDLKQTFISQDDLDISGKILYSRRDYDEKLQSSFKDLWRLAEQTAAF